MVVTNHYGTKHIPRGDPNFGTLGSLEDMEGEKLTAVKTTQIPHIVLLGQNQEGSVNLGHGRR